MADRAFGPKKAEDEIFDLANDPRWQARLDEARARRAQALRNKPPERDKPRLKPWEEQDQVIAEPLVEPFREKESDGIDLADRLERLKARKTETQYGHNGGPVSETPKVDRDPVPEGMRAPVQKDAAATTEEPDPVSAPNADPLPTVEKLSFSPNSVFDEPTFQETSRVKSEPLEEEEASESLLLPVSDIRRVSRDPQTPRRPWLIDDEPEVSVEAQQPEPPEAEETPKRRLKAPFGFAAVLLAAMITPFLASGPAFEDGPVVSATPTFAVQAELGLPSPFVNWPVMSNSDARFYTFRAKADRMHLTSPSLAPGLQRSVSGIGSGPAIDDAGPRFEVNSGEAVTLASGGPKPLSEALSGLQTDEFGLNRLRLYLRPARPALRPGVALVTEAN